MSLCVCELPRTRGSGASGARSNSSVLTDRASARRGRWSRASRRLPDSRRLSVDTSMLALRATSSSVSPRWLRSSRSRRRARRSTSFSVEIFACMANQIGRCAAARQAGSMNETKAHWEEHYGERDRVWSGRVNVQFADVVSDLPPGRALDLGCGEGGDAVWLAERGWDVVAVDISETALGRAVEAAKSRGVAERIEFIQ